VAIGAGPNQETSHSHILVLRTIVFFAINIRGSRHNTNILNQICFSIRLAGERKNVIFIVEYDSIDSGMLEESHEGTRNLRIKGEKIVAGMPGSLRGGGTWRAIGP
jgi:hypothetical protein